MKTVVLAILLFCIMIFPHELGHFIAAKKMGVKVNEFAFGMGPTLWKKQKGETLYAIRLLPVGGFCAMEGEDEDTGDSRSFMAKKPWQKIVILMAGSFMNMISAILVMAIILGVAGFTTNTIGKVSEGSSAAAAGLKSGDKIIAIDGQDISSWSDIVVNIPASEDTIEVTVKRKGTTQTVEVTPQLQQTVDEDGEVISESYVIGITSKISHSPIKAITNGAKATWNIVKLMFQSLAMLFTGQADVNDLTGPVGMVEMVSEATQIGLWYYGFLVALICVNLAIINMLPFPALDGGRILFVLFTVITGRKVSEKAEGIIHMIGLALLLTLMIYVTFNDVIRIFFGGGQS